MIYQCADCGYSQENEEFNLCPVCIEKEKAELQASAVEAHAHIEHLHALWAQYSKDVTLCGTFSLSNKIWAAVKNWEDSQCL